MAKSISGILPTAYGPLYWLALSGEVLSPTASSSLPDWFSPEEASYWNGLKSDKRRRDWSLGRRTAKHLVADFLREKTGQHVASDQIVILPHDEGWPIVRIPALGDSAPAISLSISHSHERALCAVIEGKDRSLGADIEFLERRSTAFVEEYFTSLEQQFLLAVPYEQRDAVTNAIWSGKEATLKAIRRGLSEDTRIVSCLPHPLQTGYPEWLPMRIMWNEERIERPMPQLTGCWQLMDQFVMTLAYHA